MRIATAASWPVGVAVTSWHYMWRTTPLHRRELAGDSARDCPPPIPDGVSADGLQLDDRGVGALFHRRYQARIADATVTPEELMKAIGDDPNRVAPRAMARFKPRRDGEFVIRMPGPWDGPVRTVDRTPTSFRFATLETHLEAGQIEFRAEQHGDQICFTIESWARSGDRLSKALYQHLRMAKEVQLHMWTSVLEKAARRAGGRLAGGVDIETRKVDEQDDRTRALLDDLHAKALNFDVGDQRGWKVDRYCQPLPRGSWEKAKQLLAEYAFADPNHVKAVYRPNEPLDGRDMLLEASWHGLRFRFGVRVGGVVDETRDVAGRTARVWGWNYRTLQGHLEAGEMDFEVWEWQDTGEVEFRVFRFSRRARVGNPIVRLGLYVFGWREQVKFARRACARMAALTAVPGLT